MLRIRGRRAVFLQAVSRVALSLFADRFVIADRGRVVDLASGAEVTLRFVSPSDAAWLRTWLARCAMLMAARHPTLVELADFGLAGRDRHFEALVHPHPPVAWKARDAPTARALMHLAAWLHERGLAIGPLHLADLISVDGRPALVPGERLGRPLAEDGSRDDSPAARAARATAERQALDRLVAAWTGGLVRWPRDVRCAAPSDRLRELLRQLAEVLDGGVSGRPRSLDLAFPSGLDAAVVLHAVARESRLRGYVPVQPSRLMAPGAPNMTGGWVGQVLGGRHALVLHDGRWPGRLPAASLIAYLGLDSHRPHVLLGLRGEEMALPHGAGRVTRADAACAREQAALYDTTPGAGASAPALTRGVLAHPPVNPSKWGIAEGSSAGWRVRLQQALDLAVDGRHTSALRALREQLGMLTRRGESAGGAETAFALGRVLMTRGQAAASAEAFERAHRLFEEAGLRSGAILATAFVGLCWTDEGRWLEAEAASRAARMAAASVGDTHVARTAALALARCLLWQARPAEASAVLPPDEEAGTEPAGRVAEDSTPLLPAPAGMDASVAHRCLAARIAVAADDLRAAGLSAARARERAMAIGRPSETGAACSAMATVYAALGDATALRIQVDEGLRAARQAHDPLRALRLRTVLAVGLLRAGKSSEARPLLARLRRIDRARLPAVVRRPLEVVLNEACAGPSADGRPPVRRSPPVAGAPAAVLESSGRRTDAAVVDTIVDLLSLCGLEDDEEQVVRKAVGLLRGRLHAAAVTCFGRGEGDLAPIASDGRDPLPRDVARRAADAGFAIAPGTGAFGLEAAVPVRFSGRSIGALGCRWAADLAPDWATAGGILAASAAALAPCVRSVLDRRAVPSPAVAPVTDEIVGTSPPMLRLRQEIERAARAPFNVVIEGESGSGKELVARAIHRLGPRRHHRLCAVNCAALTDELIEAELFGHSRGAFTGAVAERRGLFEEADGGTLVLDEVSELTARAQAKLLRVIQEGEVRRLGENFARSVDVRVVAASNRPLREAVESGVFRRDLLYRLEVIRILVPPLRERAEDIPLLAARLWTQATARIGSRATISPTTVAALARYDWPGNVRELQNVLASLAVQCGRRGSVGPDRLPAVIAGQAVSPGATLEDARRVFEVRFVRAALARAGGRRARAARDLGVTRQGLAKLLVRLGLEEALEEITNGCVASGAESPAAAPAAARSSSPA